LCFLKRRLGIPRNKRRNKMHKRKFGNSSESILARIANKIYIALDLTDASKLKTVVLRYIANINNDTQIRHYYTKINLFNEINKDKMTFKVFMKLLRVLSIRKIVFDITITTSLNKEVIVHEEICLDVINDSTEKEET